MKIGAATVGNSMEVPQKIKNRITTWSSIIGYLPKESKNTNAKKKYVHLYVYCSIIYNSQNTEAMK